MYPYDYIQPGPYKKHTATTAGLGREGKREPIPGVRVNVDAAYPRN